jgi:hypothetical protein
VTLGLGSEKMRGTVSDWREDILDRLKNICKKLKKDGASYISLDFCYWLQLAYEKE